jgi:hypothetical protein
MKYYTVCRTDLDFEAHQGGIITACISSRPCTRRLVLYPVKGTMQTVHSVIQGNYSSRYNLYRSVASGVRASLKGE